MKALNARKRLFSLFVTMVVAVTMVLGGSAVVFADETTTAGSLLWSYNGGKSSDGTKSISAPAYCDGYVYALIQEGNDAYLKKFAESDGTATDVAKLEGVSAGYNTLAPTIDAKAGKIYVPLTGRIAIVTADEGTVQYVNTKDNYQTISPITFDDNYLYIGTYYLNTGDYYRVNKSNIEDVTLMVENTSFYWAGACPLTIDGESYVLFGSDDAKLYLYSNKDKEVADEFNVDGKVRTTTKSDGNGNYYFSTYISFSSGKLYKVSVKDKKIVVADNYPVSLTQGSTCTPVLMDGNVYVGTAGNTVDAFSTDGEKNEDLSCKELKGNVQCLTYLNGIVYASYNNKPGGIYNVTEKQDFYVPEESLQEYNAYLPVTNGKDKIFFKNDSGYLFAVATGEKSQGGDDNKDPIVPDDSDKAGTADVYVTVSSKGILMLAQEKVKVTDIDNDGKLTVNDALYLAHENNYEGGAAAGYESAYGTYGLSLIKLWGDASGAFGYRVNNIASLSLEDVVKDGDYVNAYVYKDQIGWSDVYTWFDKNSLTVKSGEQFTLSLYATGYDENWNEIVKPVNNADITIDGKKTNYRTNESGQVTFSIDKKGTYVISAVSETDNLVPPVCKVTVADEASGTTDTATKTSDDFNLIVFAIIALVALLTAAAVFRRQHR